MKETKILLPVANPESAPTLREHMRNAALVNAHIWLRNSLVDLFGGYHQTDGTGAWRNDPQPVVIERVAVYHVATDTGAATSNTIRALAGELARRADQECVYVRFANGHVEFVKPTGGPDYELSDV